MRRAFIAAAAASLLLLAACTSGHPRTAASRTSSASRSTSPTVHRPGETVAVRTATPAGQVFTATVIAYKPIHSGNWTQQSEFVAAVDVKVCAAKPNNNISDARWRLLMADDSSSTIVATGGGPDLASPQYPSAANPYQLFGGDCVSGWINFAVPLGAQPARVRYTPTGGPVAVWALG